MYHDSWSSKPPKYLVLKKNSDFKAAVICLPYCLVRHSRVKEQPKYLPLT